MSDDQLNLRWNSYEGNLSASLNDLRASNDFFDVTLACEDDQVQCHKLVLSSCSPLLLKLFRQNLHPHPLLYLKGVEFKHLLSVLDFMYEGQVNVAQEDLMSFMATAEELKVKGLTQISDSECQEVSSPVQVKRCFKEKKQTPLLLQSPMSQTELNEFIFSPQGSVNPKQSSTVSKIVKIHDSDSPPPTPNFNFPKDPFSTPNLENTKPSDSNYHDFPPSYSFLVGGDQENNLTEMDSGKDDLPKSLKTVKSETMILKKRDGSYYCLVCKYKSENRKNVKRHVERHIPSTRKVCSLCNRSFKNRYSLSAHKSIAHKVTNLKETIDNMRDDIISSATSEGTSVGDCPWSGEVFSRDLGVMVEKEERIYGSSEVEGVKSLDGIVVIREKEGCMAVEGIGGIRESHGVGE